MDQFFEQQQQQSHGSFWYELPTVVNQYQTSAGFVPYKVETVQGGVGPMNSSSNNSGRNMNKRMIELLRTMRTRSAFPSDPSASHDQHNRCFRHMINERMRRERHKTIFSSLHALLPHGTKNDKNSIMQMAAREIQVMQRYKEELRTQNKEMEANLAALNSNEMRFKVVATSGIDSLLQVVKCLKTMGSDTISIHSKFSHHQLEAHLILRNKIADAADVENAVKKTLSEVETKKLQLHCQEGWIWS